MEEQSAKMLKDQENIRKQRARDAKVLKQTAPQNQNFMDFHGMPKETNYTQGPEDDTAKLIQKQEMRRER